MGEDVGRDERRTGNGKRAEMFRKEMRHSVTSERRDDQWSFICISRTI